MISYFLDFFSVILSIWQQKKITITVITIKISSFNIVKLWPCDDGFGSYNVTTSKSINKKISVDMLFSQFLTYFKVYNLQHTNSYDCAIICMSTIQHFYSMKLNLYSWPHLVSFIYRKREK